VKGFVKLTLGRLVQINPLPGLREKWSSLPITAEGSGWSYSAVLNRIVQSASERISNHARA
jgi:hypothetical protein